MALIADGPDPSKPTPAPGEKGLHYLKAVTVLPAGRDYQNATLEDANYKVELRREHGAIRYETSVQTSGSLLGNGEKIPLDLKLSELEALKPSTPLEWAESIRLDYTDHKTTAEGTSSIEHSMPVKLSTTWANVRQVTGSRGQERPCRDGRHRRRHRLVPGRRRTHRAAAEDVERQLFERRR